MAKSGGGGPGVPALVIMAGGVILIVYMPVILYWILGILAGLLVLFILAKASGLC